MPAEMIPVQSFKVVSKSVSGATSGDSARSVTPLRSEKGQAAFPGGRPPGGSTGTANDSPLIRRYERASIACPTRSAEPCGGHARA